MPPDNNPLIKKKINPFAHMAATVATASQPPIPPPTPPAQPAAPTFIRLRGRVVRSDNSNGMPGVNVRLVGAADNNTHGKATTDADGGFGMEVNRTIFKNEAAGAFFLVSGGDIPTGVADKVRFPLALVDIEKPVTITVPIPPPPMDPEKPATTGQPMPAGGTKQTFIVRGTIRAANGRPCPGVEVRAVDRDLRSEEPLGKTTSDREGHCVARLPEDQPHRHRPTGL
jgi:hypothetical protein